MGLWCTVQMAIDLTGSVDNCCDRTRDNTCLLSTEQQAFAHSVPANLFAVYGPVKRFVEDAVVVMRSSGLGGSTGIDTPPAPSSPRGRTGSTFSGDAPGAWLLTSLEAYVADTFLPQVGDCTPVMCTGGTDTHSHTSTCCVREPTTNAPTTITQFDVFCRAQVWVDLRGRCTSMLEDPDAFRPAPTFQAVTATAAATTSLQQQAPHVGSLCGGRPVRAIVPAAQFAAHVIGEVMSWVRDVPCIGSATLAGGCVSDGPCARLSDVSNPFVPCAQPVCLICHVASLTCLLTRFLPAHHCCFPACRRRRRSAGPRAGIGRIRHAVCSRHLRRAAPRTATGRGPGDGRRAGCTPAGGSDGLLRAPQPGHVRWHRFSRGPQGTGCVWGAFCEIAWHSSASV